MNWSWNEAITSISMNRNVSVPDPTPTTTVIHSPHTGPAAPNHHRAVQQHGVDCRPKRQMAELWAEADDTAWRQSLAEIEGRQRGAG
jgi:hypothetical protein